MSSSRSPFASTLLILAIFVLGGCRPDASSDDFERLDASPPSESGGSGAEHSSAGPALDADARPTIVFLGNSLTAGMGVSPLEAFPSLIQNRLDDADLSYRVVNAGISGETSAGGLRRIDWVLDQAPAVLVLALGANDALRGAPPETVRSNLQEIVARTLERFPETRIVIAGMLAPPNMGATYTDAFRSVFTDLAAANEAALIPFLLEGVAADPTLNQPDGIHPTAEGHEIIAATVWETLRDILPAGGAP